MDNISTSYGIPVKYVFMGTVIPKQYVSIIDKSYV